MSDIMMIEGLVGFGDLGAEIEESTFAPMYDEGRPLYDGEDYEPLDVDAGASVDISYPEGEYDTSIDLPAEAPYDPSDYDEYGQKYGVAPETAKQELQQLLDSRRKVIEQAVLERKAEEARVAQLDKQVQVLPAQTQMAVQTGDQARAQFLAYQQQMVQNQRLAAARRVIDLAKLQIVAGQMAKNTKAQIAIATLYEQAKAAGDTDIAAELSKGYEAIGNLTQQYKAVRERQFGAAKASTFKKELVKRTRTLAKLRASLKKATAANQERIQKAIEREESGIEALKQKIAEAKEQAWLTPPERLEGFLGGLGALEPYCSVAERNSGGWFTCNAIKQVELAGLDDLALAGLGSVGDALEHAFKAVAKAGKYVAEKSACPLGTAINQTIDKAAASADKKKDDAKDAKKDPSAGDVAKGIAKATAYGTASVVASDAVAQMCKSNAPIKAGVVIEGRSGWSLPWWLIPVGIVVTGGGVALYLATRSPRRAVAAPAATAGLGRLQGGRRRRRARKVRRGLSCGCGK